MALESNTLRTYVILGSLSVLPLGVSNIFTDSNNRAYIEQSMPSFMMGYLPTLLVAVPAILYFLFED